VIGAAIRARGDFFAITARPEQLQLWRLPDGHPIGQVNAPGTPWRLALSRDGRWIAAGSWDRTVQLWDVSSIAATGVPRLAAVLRGHAQLVLNEAFDPSGELLASVSNDGSLKVWDLTGLENDHVAPLASDDRRRCLVTLEAGVGAGDSLAVAFLPPEFIRGTCVAVGYIDGSVRVWDLNYFDRHMNGQLEYQRALRARK